MVGLALVIVLVAAGTGLWITWDDTQTSRASPAGRVADLAPPSTAAADTRPTTTMALAPPCRFGDDPVTTDPATDWATTIVDTRYRLPEDFVPPDLVPVTEAGFDSQDQVREVMIEDLAAMRAEAEAAGAPFVVVSGYRSFSYQAQLYLERVAQVGEEEANRRTARPGHSEHQLGTAIDVLDPQGADLTTAFADTPTGRWIADHAHEFGFVLSYPEGGIDRTCYDYEPWHLRYVGRDVAAEIHELGITPREWMAAQAARDQEG